MECSIFRVSTTQSTTEVAAFPYARCANDTARPGHASNVAFAKKVKQVIKKEIMVSSREDVVLFL